MTSSPSSKYIIELIISNIQDDSDTVVSLPQLYDLLRDYIDGKISYKDVLNFAQHEKLSIAPFEKLRGILEMDDKPIPSPPENPDKQRRKSRAWIQYEDQRLLAGILRNGIENWTPISKFVGNGRTRSQCSQRWYRSIDPRISKDQWTKAEEEKLVRLVDEYGDKSWTNIALKLGNRSDMQCRYKYRQLTKGLDLTNEHGEHIMKEVRHRNPRKQHRKIVEEENAVSTPQQSEQPAPPQVQFNQSPVFIPAPYPSPAQYQPMSPNMYTAYYQQPVVFQYCPYGQPYQVPPPDQYQQMPPPPVKFPPVPPPGGAPILSPIPTSPYNNRPTPPVLIPQSPIYGVLTQSQQPPPLTNNNNNNVQQFVNEATNELPVVHSITAPAFNATLYSVY